MKKYVALLRGINISGKNKIAMSELKEALCNYGFCDVSTLLNRGNVVFSYSGGNDSELSLIIKEIIKNKFNLDIPVFVISQLELADILNNAPVWWGDDNKEIYDNLVFLLPPLNYSEFSEKIGALKDEYEKAFNYKNVVFWSFSRQNYQKTNWWSKTTSDNIGRYLTIRTANTVKKLACK